MTSLAVEFGVPPFFAALAGFGITTLFGLLNGTLVALVRLPPFIVTLGTLNIAYAVTRIYRTTTISNLPPELTSLGRTFDIGETAITYGSILMIVLYLVIWFVLAKQRGVAMCTHWAITLKLRAWPVSPLHAC